MSKNEQNEQQKFCCNICDYITFRKSNYDRHILSDKHFRKQSAIIGNKNEQNEQNAITCEICKKTYKSYSGLWRHRKKCTIIETSNIDEINTAKKRMEKIEIKDEILEFNKDSSDLHGVIKTLINENTKLQNQVSELIPKVGNNNNNKTVNQNFNINVFLNEKCKDAINMSDFIKNIEVSLEQLDFTKHNGLANGISKTIMDNMEKLSVYERPLHCTDIKRETLYIKDNNKWEKDKNKSLIKEAIKSTTNKKIKTLHQWTEKNPDFKESEIKKDYFTHVLQAMGKESETTYDNVIKKICLNNSIKEIKSKDINDNDSNCKDINNNFNEDLNNIIQDKETNIIHNDIKNDK